MKWESDKISRLLILAGTVERNGQMDDDHFRLNFPSIRPSDSAQDLVRLEKNHVESFFFSL